MRPDPDTSRPAPDLRLQMRILQVLIAALTAVVILLTLAYFGGVANPATVQTAEAADTASIPADDPGAAIASTTTTTAAPTTTTTAAPTTTTTIALPSTPPAGAPPYQPRYVVRTTEADPGAKQLAADIALLLTTYEESNDSMERFYAITALSRIDLLRDASEPLTYPGSWSRGEVLYPQMGGLTDDRASVMVVTRQTVGSGPDTLFSVVRTLDIRLVLGEWGWQFDFLASAGGTFDSIDDLALAHSVADDPRIVMPDSARLDIRSGLVSPILLEVMADLADQTTYSVAVLTTGHPDNVFETERTSHHTLGRAVDIYAIEDNLVVDDRGSRSRTRAIVEWLLERLDVAQVGSPWDLDGPAERRSFTNDVHQDHIHLAVVED